jgi:hypothetical protein
LFLRQRLQHGEVLRTSFAKRLNPVLQRLRLVITFKG